MTAPTPPIELTGTAARWPGAVARAASGARRAARRVARSSTTSAHVAEASRDWWPLALHWSLAGEVPAAGRRRRAAGVDRRRSLPWSRVLQRARRPAHGRRWAQRRVAARRCRCSVASCSTRPALAGIVAVDATSGVVEVLAGTFGPDLERELQDAPRAERRPLPAELRHRHRRRLGGLPRRRPVLDPLRQDRGHGRRPRGRARRRQRRPHRRRAGRCRRSRSRPAVPRLGGHARRHHPGVAAGPSGRAAPSSGPRTRSPPFADGHRGLPHESCAAARRRPCCASTTPSSQHAATAATAPAACCSCSTRATRRSSTPRWRSSPTMLRPPAASCADEPRRRVDGSTATTPRRCRA